MILLYNGHPQASKQTNHLKNRNLFLKFPLFILFKYLTIHIKREQLHGYSAATPRQ
ncbi:hypothetical protein Hanom_Chr04g00321431 [Helianthus anomalus]